MARTGYRTIAAGAEALGEFEDRRSRFIASLRHVASEAEADAHLAEVRSLHHDARNNVPAWILADGRGRCSDDGEPQRTAGMPELEVLRGAGLADASVVVTRYFGGTLLGPGGLVRAYTAAVQEAVAAAEAQGLIVEMFTSSGILKCRSIPMPGMRTAMMSRRPLSTRACRGRLSTKPPSA